LTGAVIVNRKTLYLEDMMAGEAQKAFQPVDENDLELHTFLGVPLFSGDRIIGIMSVQSRQAGAYSKDQIQLIETLAVQAAVAIDKARLFDQLKQGLNERERVEADLRRRADEVSLLYQISLALTSGQDIYHALRAFVKELKRIMNVDAFHVGMYDEQTDLFTYSLFLNLGEDLQVPPRRLREKPGLTWEVISGKQTIYLKDVADPEIRRGHNIVVIVDAPVRSYVGIPLLLQDRVIGVMSVQSLQREAYSPDQIRLLETLAAQVAITIEKSRLFEQVQSELSGRQLLIHELENKNAELERFTYTVSHDLRSPLVTIRGFLGYMERNAHRGDLNAFERDMQRVVTATDRMDELLRNLLELSRVGRFINEPRAVSFEKLVRAALELVQGRIRPRGIAVRIQPDLPVVPVDQQRLVEVLQNLLDNAAKYMGDQPYPYIEIGVHGESNGRPVFYVKDNGMGIAPEYHERIFGLFNKLDVRSEGTGIGLALVKRIVEFHGGRIWVESKLGRGSTFYFTLPFKPEADSVI
jgi:signal transduction histidine kinase